MLDEGGSGKVMNRHDDDLFRERLSFLNGFVSDAERQLGVLEGLQEVGSNTGDETLAAIFQTIIPALEDRLILCAAQLLDEESGTNLRKLVSHYKENKHKISHKDSPIPDTRIDELMSIDHLAGDKIRLLRNKAIAHLDRQFTQAPNTFLNEVGLSFETDIIAVVNHAQMVLAELSLAVDCSARVSVGKIFAAATIMHFHREGKLA